MEVLFLQVHKRALLAGEEKSITTGNFHPITGVLAGEEGKIKWLDESHFVFESLSNRGRTSLPVAEA